MSKKYTELLDRLIDTNIDLNIANNKIKVLDIDILSLNASNKDYRCTIILLRNEILKLNKK